jgi:transposase
MARRALIKAYQRAGNISLVARLFRTTRKTVRKALQRYNHHGEEGLKDISRRPRHSPNKTPLHIEAIILAERKRTGYGRDRIARNLRARGIDVTASQVRYVLRRHKVSGKYKRSKYRKRQRYYDFEGLYPLQHFEVDLKEIYDQGTLSGEAIRHATSIGVPLYQWTAIDVKTRLRFISYSSEKSFTNGLVFMMSIIYFLRALGIRHEIVLQTDNGEEFGGKSVEKLEYLNRCIFRPLNGRLIHIPKGRKEYNAFVERSHQTDDNEFYIPQLELCRDVREFFLRAMRWQWVYNTVRIHSAIEMTPYRKLLQYMRMPKYIALFPVMDLDRMIDIFQIFFPKTLNKGGYYVSTNDQGISCQDSLY